MSGRAKDAKVEQEQHAAAQPRPALGRRPWFALLRRARSLRRFAFAMRTETVADVADRAARASQSDGWMVSDVTLAAGLLARFRGAKGGRSRILLQGGAVHGRGLAEPLTVVALDATGVVLAVETLRPGRFLTVKGAAWALELATTIPPPRRGDALRLYARRL